MMKKEYLPYYFSRAALSSGFAILAFGLTWQAAPVAILVFGLFLLYLHSGWFTVDLAHPFFPLRRDSFGQTVQRKALIGSVAGGLLTFLILSRLNDSTGAPIVAGQATLAVAVIIYFITQVILFSRA
jgi:hypothetical protein